MDRRDRQSSLPSSLIPHLYAAPRDSSTRTTLTSHSEDSDQGSNISSLPLLPLIPPHRPSSSYLSIPDDRQLPPVLPANPSYRSLEPSSNPHRSVSPTYSNQKTLFLPSSRSSPTIILPSLASLSADIFPRSSWREGEAGPSSLIHPGQRDYDSRHLRGESQPARVISPPNAFGYGSTSRELHRQDTGYHPTFSHQCMLYFSLIIYVRMIEH